MHKAEDYTYRVFWSEEDKSFISTVAEWPRLSSDEDTQDFLREQHAHPPQLCARSDK